MKKNWLDVIATIDAKIEARFENHIPEIFVIKNIENSEIKTDGILIAKLLKPKISMLVFCKTLNGRFKMLFEKKLEKFRFVAVLALSISPAVRPFGAKNKV